MDTESADIPGSVEPPKEHQPPAAPLQPPAPPTPTPPPGQPAPRAKRSSSNLLNQPAHVALGYGLPRFLFIHNPFYLISAALVFYGLYTRFNSSSVGSNGWWLVGLMTAYTAILAITAALIVRYGKVWQDARSILILVPMLFLATSVSLDELGIRHTREMAVPLVLTAFAAAILISQALIRGMKLRLRAYYPAFLAILAVFFLYPLGVMLYQEYVAPSDVKRLAFAVLGFPLAQAIAWLTLLPAIRRGPEYVKDNGTPWGWPLFPLSLFFLLALAVCARQYFLTLSFIPIEGMSSPFGTYALVPFILVVALLILEMALAGGHVKARSVAMALPLLAVIFSFSSADRSGVYDNVLEMIHRSAGTPVLWAIGGALLFYLYAAIRRVPGTEAGFLFVLAIASTVGADTLDTDTLVQPRPWALAVIAAVEFILCWRRKSSGRALLGLMVLICAFISGASDKIPVSWIVGIAIHICLIGILAIGAIFRDKLAQVLETFAAAVWVPLVFVIPFLATEDYSKHQWLPLTYSAVMTALAFGYWRLTGRPGFRKAGVRSSGLVIFHFAIFVWQKARNLEEHKGLTAMLLGMAFFVLAVVISLIKGGVFHRRSQAAPPGENAEHH